MSDDDNDSIDIERGHDEDCATLEAVERMLSEMVQNHPHAMVVPGAWQLRWHEHGYENALTVFYPEVVELFRGKDTGPGVVWFGNVRLSRVKLGVGAVP